MFWHLLVVVAVQLLFFFSLVFSPFCFLSFCFSFSLSFRRNSKVMFCIYYRCSQFVCIPFFFSSSSVFLFDFLVGSFIHVWRLLLLLFSTHAISHTVFLLLCEYEQCQRIRVSTCTLSIDR